MNELWTTHTFLCCYSSCGSLLSSIFSKDLHLLQLVLGLATPSSFSSRPPASSGSRCPWKLIFGMRLLKGMLSNFIFIVFRYAFDIYAISVLVSILFPFNGKWFYLYLIVFLSWQWHSCNDRFCLLSSLLLVRRLSIGSLLLLLRRYSVVYALWSTSFKLRLMIPSY